MHERRRCLPILTVLLLVCLPLAVVLVPTARAQTGLRFTEAEVFLELNDTDGDLGIHASIDGAIWTDLEIEGPSERPLLNIVTSGRMRAQGLTQLSIESAEPPFDELPPEEFFRRFPEGRYSVEGLALDGRTILGRAVLSHVLAAPPENVLVSGVPAADSCDAESLPQVVPPVVIDWDPVTESHPEIGRAGRITVSRYQFFVEREGVKLSVDLPPNVTEFEVPTAITALGADFKFEIIVRTSAGNNTAIESCFEVVTP